MSAALNKVNLAEKLATFTAGLRFDMLPPNVVANVRLRMLDVIGLALAASTRDFAAPTKEKPKGPSVKFSKVAT